MAPAAGASLAVMKSSSAIEKLAAKVGRRERSGGANASVAAKSAAQSVEDLLRPGGQYVGIVQAGATPNIRTVTPQEFASLKYRLLDNAKFRGQYAGGMGTWYELPDGGRIGVRLSDKSGLTLDIDLPGFPKGFKVHKNEH